MARYSRDPFRGITVIFAPERVKRPHEGDGDFVCPFCPGNESLTPPEVLRVGNENWRIRVFPNKYPFAEIHEVIVESPDHLSDIDQFSVEHMEEVIKVWMERMRFYRENAYTIVFRNYGKISGASILHPHSQLVSLNFVPDIPAKELEVLREGKCLLCNVEENFLYLGEDIILGVPRIPSHPRELWIFPRGHIKNFYDFENTRDLAEVMIKSVKFIKEVFGIRDYNMIIHSAPKGFDYHWHIEIIPRKGYLAGFEFGTGIFINHHPPEKIFESLKVYLPIYHLLDPSTRNLE